MAHKSDEQLISSTHNTARFFAEQTHIPWVLLVAVIGWGLFGFFSMPQRKDPVFPNRVAMAVVRWPGMPVEKVEQLVTKKVEERVAQNASVDEIKSTTRVGEAVVFIQLNDQTDEDSATIFDDIKLKLDSLTDLPQGALRPEFYKDFGDTAALMLTVASPRVDGVELDLRARDVQQAVQQLPVGNSRRFSVAVCFPIDESADPVRQLLKLTGAEWERTKFATDPRTIEGRGFVLLNAEGTASDAAILASLKEFSRNGLQEGEAGPDIWDPVVLRDPAQIRDRLASVAGNKYSYRQLDTYTDQIEKSVRLVPSVAQVNRSGVLPEEVQLSFSQDRLASYGVSLATVTNALQARNAPIPAGVVSARGQTLRISADGEFNNIHEIGDVIVGASRDGAPLYLRDMVDIQRGYQAPSQFQNSYFHRDAAGQWIRSRAITLDIHLRPDQQIATFGKDVDANLAQIKHSLPPDLILAHTSDQARQVSETIKLFTRTLGEAIVLVVLVSLIGFREWRTALVMALAIPITLAITFGMMYAVGMDLQQVSIATLIIALGLLIDDPIVAGDAIKRELAANRSPRVAAWLGPTKLSRAILFATITNIAAYLPFLLMQGDNRKFLLGLPVVITCSLIASRLVSMTFIPFFGRYLLRADKVADTSQLSQSGTFATRYRKSAMWVIEHRWTVLACSSLLLFAGVFCASQLKQQFFPKDLQYLCWVDVWTPEGSSFASTMQATKSAEQVIRATADEYDKTHTAKNAAGVLESLTSWVGGGPPRYWYSSAPEPRQLNYAHILIQVQDKRDTRLLVPLFQSALSAQVPGARFDVRELETSAPIGVPVQLRVSGTDIPALRATAERLKDILRQVPYSSRVRDDWGEDILSLELATSAERANQAGITNGDVAQSSMLGFSGQSVGVLRDGDKNIPLVARLRVQDRSQPGELNDLYVFSQANGNRVSLQQIANVDYQPHPGVIHRVNEFRTITVSAFSTKDKLPSEVLAAAMPGIQQVQNTLPPGVRIELAGEYKEQVKGTQRQSRVMLISVLSIYLVLVLQFRHALKPLIVFSAVPFGIMGGFMGLYLTHSPFGFMAFLGLTSLIGVIVSHIIVLFDAIEEHHERGSSLQAALLEAGVSRLRPVLITVAATVVALIPLSINGGPLWQPLCYVQMGGLLLSTLVTLVLAPVIYAVLVLDLKWISWTTSAQID